MLLLPLVRGEGGRGEATCGATGFTRHTPPPPHTHKHTWPQQFVQHLPSIAIERDEHGSTAHLPPHHLGHAHVDLRVPLPGHTPRKHVGPFAKHGPAPQGGCGAWCWCRKPQGTGYNAHHLLSHHVTAATTTTANNSHRMKADGTAHGELGGGRWPWCRETDMLHMDIECVIAAMNDPMF